MSYSQLSDVLLFLCTRRCLFLRWLAVYKLKTRFIDRNVATALVLSMLLSSKRNLQVLIRYQHPQYSLDGRSTLDNSKKVYRRQWPVPRT
jgi:hypothetical protein